MPDKARRREIAAAYRQVTPDAGVYRLRCADSSRLLLGSTVDLRSAANKLSWAKTTSSPGVLGWRFAAAVAEVGLDALSFEVVEVLEVMPGSTAAELRSRLAALEARWREALAASGPPVDPVRPPAPGPEHDARAAGALIDERRSGR